MSTQTRYLRILFALLSIGSIALQEANAQQATYQGNIQPLFKKFCNECHEGEQAEAEIDLVRFESISQIRESTKIWQRVSKMLVSRQMPPADAAQPTDRERQLLSDWVRDLLRKEAEAHSGDPGPVTLRRLNNAEYTYSIRDLTGIDSLDPADEFPVDGAAGEGFNNTGDALGMSPALVSKYLDAAKQISQHAVLMPDGVRFSKETTRRDWTDTALAKIRQFYFQFADDGGNFLDWEGKNASTPRNGRIPLQAYIGAIMTHRDTLRSESISIEQVARQNELSPKYLKRLWSVFGGSEDHGFLLNELRAKSAITNDVDSIVATIERWQQSLWQFNSIGHLGRRGAPKNWMTRKDPITDRQRVTLELPTAAQDKEIVIYLTAASISGDDAVVAWRKPTIQFPGRSPILLRDIAGATERLAQQLQQVVEIDSLAAQEGAVDERFGRHPDSIDVSNTDLFAAVPSTTEIRIPAALASEGLLIVDVECESPSGSSAIQVGASLSPPQPTDLVPGQPILVSPVQTKRQSVVASLDQFCDLFPAALCYTQIVPVDEVVTLQLYYREDHHFKRLMCDDEQTDALNRIWDELFFVAQEPLVSEVALEQSLQFATQDRPDLVPEFDELKAKYRDRAEAFRRRLALTEPVQVNSLVEFAGHAWRRKLTSSDSQRLQTAYAQFRDQKLTHDEAIRLLLVRILVAPSFLYRLETPGEGQDATDVSDYELASRLSYFLWSATPDEPLLKVAESGGLRSDEAIVAQTGRMLADPKMRRMAIHFACQWLHLRDFDKTVEKNERLYPKFAQYSNDLYEETIRFFEDMFRNDGSILDLIASDHTFVNEPVARHYGFEGVTGSHWQRVEGIRSKGRGGILAMATVLASQSGASRTSPILRGNWVYETLLGERLPRPPAGIPQLPESVPEGKTARELIELHSGSPQCARCHEKIDPYGFALEQFDAIGRLRPTKVDSKTTLPDGQSIEGLDGLRDYLMGQRRDDIVHQFCKKLLGYALGRETQLSDEPLLERTQIRLRDHNYRFSVAVESIVTSPQFRQIRGRLANADSLE